MTGIVTSIRGTQQSYCHIQGEDGTVYFSHQLNFVNPAEMVVGNEVSFNVAKAMSGPRPNAIDVVAIQRKAA
ncbi:MAG TPA: hypothetical protein VN517_03885 [Terriglobales bacterium]|nr:hypothetical protein [Terriglobales bacterium]